MNVEELKKFIAEALEEDADLDELGGEALEAEDLEPAEEEEEEKKIELELEIKDDKIEVEANVDNVEFEGELKPEGTLEEAPAEEKAEEEEIEESLSEGEDKLTTIANLAQSILDDFEEDDAEQKFAYAQDIAKQIIELCK